MVLIKRKAVKVTMPTFTAQTLIKTRKVAYPAARNLPAKSYGMKKSNRGGFTFVEMVIITVIVGLFAVLAQTHLLGLMRKTTFKAQVQEFISVMQMAATAAAESNKRYEVIIDLADQSYLFCEKTSADLSEVLEENIIVENHFGRNCRAVYVQFDDGDFTHDGRAKFRAGHAGWAYGGKIVLLNVGNEQQYSESEQPYSVVVNRLNRIVKLKEGDVDLLEPKRGDDLIF